MIQLPVYKSNILNAFTEVKHGFFTRQGGVSLGCYDNLNMALTKTDPIENVLENYRIVGDWFGIDGQSVMTAHQTHSVAVHKIEKNFSHVSRPHADALITEEKNIAIGVLTADCVPILMYAPGQHLIAAIHAGWKGAKDGVIASTVAELNSLGLKREDVVAALGPCIHQESYEVDAMFYGDFIQENIVNKQFFQPSTRINHYFFNLPGYVMNKLNQEGITKIDALNYDTYSNERLFFSYRRAIHRQESVFGNQISAILLA